MAPLFVRDVQESRSIVDGIVSQKAESSKGEFNGIRNLFNELSWEVSGLYVELLLDLTNHTYSTIVLDLV